MKCEIMIIGALLVGYFGRPFVEIIIKIFKNAWIEYCKEKAKENE